MPFWMHPPSHLSWCLCASSILCGECSQALGTVSLRQWWGQLFRRIRVQTLWSVAFCLWAWQALVHMKTPGFLGWWLAPISTLPSSLLPVLCSLASLCPQSLSLMTFRASQVTLSLRWVSSHSYFYIRSENRKVQSLSNLPVCPRNDIRWSMVPTWHVPISTLGLSPRATTLPPKRPGYHSSSDSYCIL